MKKYHYPYRKRGVVLGGGGKLEGEPNVERVINLNVLSVPRLTNADLADSSGAEEEYKSSHAELIKSDNARLMLATLATL